MSRGIRLKYNSAVIECRGRARGASRLAPCPNPPILTLVLISSIQLNAQASAGQQKPAYVQDQEAGRRGASDNPGKESANLQGTNTLARAAHSQGSNKLNSNSNSTNWPEPHICKGPAYWQEPGAMRGRTRSTTGLVIGLLLVLVHSSSTDAVQEVESADELDFEHEQGEETEEMDPKEVADRLEMELHKMEMGKFLVTVDGESIVVKDVALTEFDAASTVRVQTYTFSRPDGGLPLAKLLAQEKHGRPSKWFKEAKERIKKRSKKSHLSGLARLMETLAAKKRKLLLPVSNQLIGEPPTFSSAPESASGISSSSSLGFAL
eukprot:gene17638-23982_t